MKWLKTKDKLPIDQQEVLIKYRGIVNLAKFNQENKGFVLRNGEVLMIKDDLIEWMELISPMQQK